jgi:hypothetical protein
MIRNYILSSSLFGNKSHYPLLAGNVTFFQQVSNTYHFAASIFDHVLSWYLPERITNSRPLLIFLSLAIGFIAALEYKDNWKKLCNLLQVYPILMFVAIYTGFLLLIKGPGLSLETRYLSPIFVPMTLLPFILVEKLLKPLLDRLFPKYANILLVAVTAVWLIFPTRAMVQVTSYQIEKGSQYTSETWKTSETIGYLIQHRALESACTIYTNGPDVTYLLTGLKTKKSPQNALNGGVTDIFLLKGLWPQESKICLVWFDNIAWRAYWFPPEELMSIVSLEKTIRLQDGTIYFFSKK